MNVEYNSLTLIKIYVRCKYNLVLFEHNLQYFVNVVVVIFKSSAKMLRLNLRFLTKITLNESVNVPTKSTTTNLIRKCSATINIPNENIKQHKQLANDTNTFGTLTKPLEMHEEEIDEKDKEEEKYLGNILPNAKKLRTSQYATIIKDFIRKRQINEAIDVLAKKILKEDKAKPDNYIYNLLMGACGRLGYTKKAFNLFNDMKKRGLQPTGGTYTALFNACSNSPWPDDGLTRAQKLRELMFEKGVLANDTTYNAMIKAFGRCGDIKTAFSIVDEMITNRIPIRTPVINFLLHSCICNKVSGLLQALLVWRKFKQNKIVPDIYSFNLLLHCIRDCELGDSEVAEKLLDNLNNNALKLEWNEHEQITGAEKLTTLEHNNVNSEYPRHIPNLLAEIPYLGNMVKLGEIKTPEQRLLLVGGFSGLLNTMEKHQVSPDIKTFTILLANLTSSTSAEYILLKAMKKTKVTPDIDFLNMLIKKRSLRYDYQNAKEVMNLFDKYQYKPNIITYGVLALCCETLEESRMLLQEMSDKGYRVNVEILGTLARQASVKENFVWVLEIMELVVKSNIKPNKRFLQHLDKLRTHVQQQLRQETQRGSFWKNGSKIFLKRYKTWLTEIEPDKIEETHPWEQFRNPVETNIKNYKDKQIHFKPRVSSRFRVKTGTIKKNIN